MGTGLDGNTVGSRWSGDGDGRNGDGMRMGIKAAGTERGWGDELVAMQLSTWNSNLARFTKCD